MLMREKAVAAIQGHDFLISPTSPITAYAVDEPARPFRSHRLHRTLQYVGATDSLDLCGLRRWLGGHIVNKRETL